MVKMRSYTGVLLLGSKGAKKRFFVIIKVGRNNKNNKKDALDSLDGEEGNGEFNYNLTFGYKRRKRRKRDDRERRKYERAKRNNGKKEWKNFSDISWSFGKTHIGTKHCFWVGIPVSGGQMGNLLFPLFDRAVVSEYVKPLSAWWSG